MIKFILGVLLLMSLFGVCIYYADQSIKGDIKRGAVPSQYSDGRE